MMFRFTSDHSSTGQKSQTTRQARKSKLPGQHSKTNLSKKKNILKQDTSSKTAVDTYQTKDSIMNEVSININQALLQQLWKERFFLFWCSFFGGVGVGGSTKR